MSRNAVAKTAIAQLVLTSVHHVYGAQRYDTPWRLHVLLLSVPAMLVIFAASRRESARWVLVLVTLVVPVLAIGAFEGVYNHLLKDILYAAGAPMGRLFPAPMYEMPNDAFFEITGVAQAFVGAGTAVTLYRFASRARVSRTFVDPHRLTTIANQPIQVPDPASLVHLQFRRFAGCPVCNLHLQAFARRHRELAAAGVREVVVFHSSADDLRMYASDLPFSVVGDPEKQLYAEFGVGSSPRAVLDPRAWAAIALGVVASLVARVRRGAVLPPVLPRGGGLGLPADFLIATDGRVIASKYGRHADDQWSVDEVLALARGLV